MLIRYINNLRWPALILVSWVAILIPGRGGIYQVLELAVDLKPGTITLPEFQVNMEGQYEIRLAVVDVRSAQNNKSPEPVVDIEWTLMSVDNMVASGSFRNEEVGASGRGFLYRILGQFDGLPQTPYVLEVNILRDGSALAPAKPRIVVWLGSEDYLDKIIIPRSMSTLLTVIAMLGIISLWDVMDLRCQENPVKEIRGDAPQAEIKSLRERQGPTKQSRLL